MPKLTLCADSLSWETQLWTPPTGIPRDPPLSKHGVDQAHELAQFLKNDLGITSPEQAKQQGIAILSSSVSRVQVGSWRKLTL